jgi:signal peptidase I
MKEWKRSLLKSWARTLVILIAVVGIAYLVSYTFGLSVYVVSSPSMEPHLSIGDLIIVYRVNAESIVVGDVIVFYKSLYGSEVVVHRVVEKYDSVFTTKGDANPMSYPWERWITMDRIVGEVLFFVPKLGLLRWLVPQQVKLPLMVGLIVFIFFIDYVAARKKAMINKNDHYE